MSDAGVDEVVPVHPPVAPVETTVHELHGVRRVDDYGWLRDKDSARTRAYLKEERAFYDASTAHLVPLRHELFAEMSARTLPADESVSWAHGGYVYSTRTVEGREYTQLLRRSAEDLAVGDAATVILDVNELADGHDYCRVGICEPSPDGRLLAYAVDLTGDEVYTLRFRDLETGRDLPDVVDRAHSMGGAWSADATHFFYAVPDAAWRSHRVLRHELGTAGGRGRRRLRGHRREVRGPARGVAVRRLHRHPHVRPRHVGGLAGADGRPDGRPDGRRAAAPWRRVPGRARAASRR